VLNFTEKKIDYIVLEKIKRPKLKHEKRKEKKEA